MFAGVVGGLGGRAVALVAPLVVIPKLLSYLGAEGFGVWITALSVTSMSMFIDLGIGNGLLTRLSAAYGAGNSDEMRRLISSAYFALASIAAVLLFGIVVTWAALHAGVWPVAPERMESSHIALVCAATFVISMPVLIIQRVMIAFQLVWLSNLWSIAGAVASVGSCLLAIHLNAGGWQAIAAYSVPPLILMMVAAGFFFNGRKEVAPRLSASERATVWNLLVIGSRFLLLGVLTSAALNADNLLIAARLDVASVAEYAVPAKLGSLLGLMVTSIFLPLWPANGEALVRKDFKWLRNSTRKMSLLGGISVALAAAFITIFSQDILTLWMGRSFEGAQEIVLFLGVMYSIMAISSPYQMLLNSAGRLKVQICAWSVYLVMTVLAKIVLLDADKLWLIPLVSAAGFAGIIVPAMYVAGAKLLGERAHD